ncbi:discoidin domain-containing protein [Rugosimonospora africana]|uniref:F5/8 type C domain-containing protein n=1 Tax=Rugosimonospora africana TaxID=556532 RepID=A0A8J3QV44_9ACTN|nr:discoidin domain-containing protein [Rugosimonospora africana]GIH16667.1 hypothetical protein Raf01_48390 [Rugosimonospora africana]
MHVPAESWGRRRGRIYAAIAAVLLALVGGYAATTALPASAASSLLSQGKPATASSVENAGTPASAAVDGNLTGTRWSSQFSDPQWIQVDLGQVAALTQITVVWESAYATAFQLQSSNDGTTWTTLQSVTNGTGGTQTYNVSGSGRYVRLYGTARATGYGYSLYEFQVYGSTGTTSPTPSSTACDTATNAALNKPATASSTENGGTPASSAVDGSGTTRWSSAASDPQWLTVDLGSAQPICQVQINWETAYGKAFQIQVSNDNATWTVLSSITNGTGGNQVINVSGSGRYVRVYGTARGTGYGYSIWEFIVHLGGTATSPSPTPSTSPTPSPTGTTGPIQGGGSLGPNVIVFDPSMSSTSIQSRLDSVFAQQETAQFGTGRYELLFKPGSYSGLNAQIGFYTSIAGLGQNPDDVALHGDITVDAGWNAGNATLNFWRSAENMSLYPVSGTDRWAVAQAAPFRRMDVHGGMTLASPNCGWASGGYIADSRVSGTIGPCSQQQWYTRNSTIGGWNGAVWNMVFSGVQGAPAQSFPNPPYTVLPTTPVTEEKPYLYTDTSGAYRVFVPSLQNNSSGATWLNGNTPGTSIPLTSFYVAQPGVSVATLNAALAQGLNLLFTPGIYHINAPINVTRADTVVMGLGYATLEADNGVTPLNIADVNGVKVSSLLIDAGTTNSASLMQVGPAGSSASHASDPSLVQDVFFRIGGAGPAAASAALVVNSSNTIIDHIWAWRADHGAGAGWTTNPANNGLIVNGANVSAYGLFVEHFQQYNVVWNGNGGKTIFFQNELPYDPPSAAAWSHDGMTGWAAYKVANTVTTHEAWGLGSYCVFTTDSSIAAYHSFEVPNTAGVKFHDVLTVSLGKGSITHVINDTGDAALPSSVVPHNVVSFP